MNQSGDRSVVDLAAYGGEGWSPRGPSTKDELGSLWHGARVASEWETLRAVMLHRPGRELENIHEPDKLQLSQVPNVERLRAAHDRIAEAYRRHDVEVIYVDPPASGKVPPNLLFCRDSFVMTPEGAIVSRMASTVRAGEESLIARRLADLGIPILLTVRGPGVFEGGAEMMWVDSGAVLLSCGLRTNPEGVRQVEGLLKSMGVEVVIAALPIGAMHLLGTVNIVGPDLAIAWPGTAPYAAVRLLKDRGFRVLYLPDQAEREVAMALNFVTLRRNKILMPSHCPRTRDLLESAGVECIELDLSELIKAEGAVACATGILWRQQ